MLIFNYFKLAILASLLLCSSVYTELFAQQTEQSLKLVWSKTFPRMGTSHTQLITLPDGGYLYFGSPSENIDRPKSEDNRGGSDYWVLRLNASWKILWDKTLGGTEDETLVDVLVLDDGSFILGGYSVSGVSGEKTEASQGGSDFWLVKLDSQGNKLWDKTFGGDQDDTFSSMILLSDDNILLGGYSDSNISGAKSEASKGGTDYWIINIRCSRK